MVDRVSLLIPIFTVRAVDDSGGSMFGRRSRVGYWIVACLLGLSFWQLGQGAYIPAKTTAYDLGRVYEDHLAGLTRGEVLAEKRKRYRERFQLFIFLGLTALLLEMVIPRYPRRGEGG